MKEYEVGSTEWIEQITHLIVMSMMLFERSQQRRLNDQEKCIEYFFRAFGPPDFSGIVKKAIAKNPGIILNFERIDPQEKAAMKFHAQKAERGFIDRLIVGTSPVVVHLPGGEGFKENDYVLLMSDGQDRDVLSIVQALESESGGKGGKFGVLKPFLFNIDPKTETKH